MELKYELQLGSSKHPEVEFIGDVPLYRAWSLRFVTPQQSFQHSGVKYHHTAVATKLPDSS